MRSAQRNHVKLWSGRIWTGPVLIFINLLYKYVKETQADHVVICWDDGPSVYRTGLDPKYKSSRKVGSDSRFVYSTLRHFLDLAGFQQESRSGWEGDDLIAAYVRDTPGEIVILTCDKDLLQLLRPGVSMVRMLPMKSAAQAWDHTRVLQEYGVPAEQLSKLLALTGDAIDDVPGVPGIGVKTAQKLLVAAQYSLRAIDNLKVQEHNERVKLSYKLVDLPSAVRDLQVIPVKPYAGPDWYPLEAFLDQYGFKQLKARYLSGKLALDGAPMSV